MCALGLAFVLLAVVPLADASPPDPLWIPGIYDGGDFDEAVTAVVAENALAAVRIVAAPPIVVPVEPTWAPDSFSIGIPLVSSLSTRAPPSSLVSSPNL